MNEESPRWYVEVQLFATDDLEFGPFWFREEAIMVAKQYTAKHISDMYHSSIFQSLENVGYYEDDNFLIRIHIWRKI